MSLQSSTSALEKEKTEVLELRKTVENLKMERNAEKTKVVQNCKIKLALQETVHSLEADLTKKKLEAGELQKAVGTLEEEKKIVKEKMEEWATQLGEKKLRLDETESECRRLEMSLQSSASALEKEKTEVLELRKAVENLNEKKEKLIEELNILKAAQQQSTINNEFQLKKLVKDHEDEMKKQKDTVSVLKKNHEDEVKRLKESIDSLEDNVHNLEKSNEALEEEITRSKMKTAQKNLGNFFKIACKTAANLLNTDD